MLCYWFHDYTYKQRKPFDHRAIKKNNLHINCYKLYYNFGNSRFGSSGRVSRSRRAFILPYDLTSETTKLSVRVVGHVLYEEVCSFCVFFVFCIFLKKILSFGGVRKLRRYLLFLISKNNCMNVYRIRVRPNILIQYYNIDDEYHNFV